MAVPEEDDRLVADRDELPTSRSGERGVTTVAQGRGRDVIYLRPLSDISACWADVTASLA